MPGSIEPPLTPRTICPPSLSVQEKIFSVAVAALNLEKQEKDHPHASKQAAGNARSPPRAFLISHAPPARKAATAVRGVGLAWACGGMLSCTSWLSEGAKSLIAPRHAMSTRFRGLWIGAVIQTKKRPCLSSSVSERAPANGGCDGETTG
jgi:hypothetical protein